MHDLRWEVYTKYKKELIKRELSFPHPKGEDIVWTFLKVHIIDENDKYKAIGLSGFGYKLF